MFRRVMKKYLIENLKVSLVYRHREDYDVKGWPYKHVGHWVAVIMLLKDLRTSLSEEYRKLERLETVAKWKPFTSHVDIFVCPMRNSGDLLISTTAQKEEKEDFIWPLFVVFLFSFKIRRCPLFVRENQISKKNKKNKNDAMLFDVTFLTRLQTFHLSFRLLRWKRRVLRDRCLPERVLGDRESGPWRGGTAEEDDGGGPPCVPRVRRAGEIQSWGEKAARRTAGGRNPGEMSFLCSVFSGEKASSSPCSTRTSPRSARRWRTRRRRQRARKRRRKKRTRRRGRRRRRSGTRSGTGRRRKLRSSLWTPITTTKCRWRNCRPAWSWTPTRTGRWALRKWRLAHFCFLWNSKGHCALRKSLGIQCQCVTVFLLVLK